jgi:hypothetical protein
MSTLEDMAVDILVSEYRAEAVTILKLVILAPKSNIWQLMIFVIEIRFRKRKIDKLLILNRERLVRDLKILKDICKRNKILNQTAEEILSGQALLSKRTSSHSRILSPLKVLI